MKRRLERTLRWYPSRWRDRYGEELLALIEDQVGEGRVSLSLRASLVWSGLREHGHEAGVVGRAAPEVRRRGGSLLVLVAWAGMIVAGAMVAKFAEHFSSAMPASSRASAQIAYDVLAVSGIAGTLLVGAGAVLALPALARLIKSGGWLRIRASVAASGVATILSAGGLLAVSQWGHHLRTLARNGADLRYGMAALALAATAIVTLALWCVAAAKVATTVEFTARELRRESALALGVALAAALATVGALLWWFVVATRASWFLQGAARGVESSPWPAPLVVASSIMIASLVVASWGVVRVRGASRA